MMAGLLARGSSPWTAFPELTSSSGVSVLGSPLTVAGAATALRKFALTAFPFDPLSGTIGFMNHANFATCQAADQATVFGLPVWRIVLLTNRHLSSVNGCDFWRPLRICVTLIWNKRVTISRTSSLARPMAAWGQIRPCGRWLRRGSCPSTPGNWATSCRLHSASFAVVVPVSSRHARHTLI